MVERCFRLSGMLWGSSSTLIAYRVIYKTHIPAFYNLRFLLEYLYACKAMPVGKWLLSPAAKCRCTESASGGESRLHPSGTQLSSSFWKGSIYKSVPQKKQTIFTLEIWAFPLSVFQKVILCQCTHTHKIFFLVWNWPYFYVDFGSILDYQACDSNCSHTQNPGCYSSYYSVFCNIYSLWRSYYQWYLLRCAVTQNFPLQSGSLIYQAGYKQIYLGNLSQERLHKKCAIHENPVGSWHFV